jgi:hypothetical protein
VARFLSPFAWIWNVHPDTQELRDLAVFRCSAWVLDLASIPPVRDLWIVEPPVVSDEDPPGKKTLIYPIEVRYSAVACSQGISPVQPPPPPPEEDGSGDRSRRQQQGQDQPRSSACSPPSRRDNRHSGAAGAGDRRCTPVHDRLGARSIGNGHVEVESPGMHSGAGVALHDMREHPGSRLLLHGVTTSQASMTNQEALVHGVDLNVDLEKSLDRCLDEQHLDKRQAPIDMQSTGFEDNPSIASPTLACFLSEATLSQGLEAFSSTGLNELSPGLSMGEERKSQVGLCCSMDSNTKKEKEELNQLENRRNDGPYVGAFLQDELGLRSPLHSLSIPSFEQLLTPAFAPSPGGEFKVYTRR